MQHPGRVRVNRGTGTTSNSEQDKQRRGTAWGWEAVVRCLDLGVSVRWGSWAENSEHLETHSHWTFTALLNSVTFTVSQNPQNPNQTLQPSHQGSGFDLSCSARSSYGSTPCTCQRLGSACFTYVPRNSTLFLRPCSASRGGSYWDTPPISFQTGVLPMEAHPIEGWRGPLSDPLVHPVALF